MPALMSFWVAFHFGLRASESVLSSCKRQDDQLLSSKTLTYRPPFAMGLYDASASVKVPFLFAFTASY